MSGAADKVKGLQQRKGRSMMSSMMSQQQWLPGEVDVDVDADDVGDGRHIMTVCVLRRQVTCFDQRHISPPVDRYR